MIGIGKGETEGKFWMAGGWRVLLGGGWWRSLLAGGGCGGRG